MRRHDQYLQWLYRGAIPVGLRNSRTGCRPLPSGPDLAAACRALEVRGRKSGRMISLPVVFADPGRHAVSR
jgi:hypothetical protein